MSHREKGFGAESLNLTWQFASLLHVWTCQLDSNTYSINNQLNQKHLRCPTLVLHSHTSFSTSAWYFDYYRSQSINFANLSPYRVSIYYHFLWFHLISTTLLYNHLDNTIIYQVHSPSLFTMGYLLILNINKYELQSVQQQHCITSMSLSDSHLRWGLGCHMYASYPY